MTKHSLTNLFFGIGLLSLLLLSRYSHAGYGWYIVLFLLYTLVIALGSYFIGLQFFISSYYHGDRSKPQIAITFDDGPNDSTSKTLDVLKENKTPATFFCIGRNLAGNEAILERIDQEGHLIGTHSYHHHWSFPLQKKEKIAAEISQCQAEIDSVIHKKPLLFRPPFGVTDPPLAAAIELSGVSSIGWSVRSYDTVISSSDKLLDRVRHIKNGDIILFHEAGLQTNVILSAFIEYVRTKGFEIVPLDQLLALKAYEN